MPSLPSPPVSITHERQLEMLRRALEGKVGRSREEQESFVEEFVAVQARQEDSVRGLVQAHRDLRQVGTHSHHSMHTQCYTLTSGLITNQNTPKSIENKIFL